MQMGVGFLVPGSKCQKQKNPHILLVFIAACGAKRNFNTNEEKHLFRNSVDEGCGGAPHPPHNPKERAAHVEDFGQGCGVLLRAALQADQSRKDYGEKGAFFWIMTTTPGDNKKNRHDMQWGKKKG
jgi:hypothetical protein